jgi:hypothetical protein
MQHVDLLRAGLKDQGSNKTPLRSVRPLPNRKPSPSPRCRDCVRASRGRRTSLATKLGRKKACQYSGSQFDGAVRSGPLTPLGRSTVHDRGFFDRLIERADYPIHDITHCRTPTGAEPGGSRRCVSRTSSMKPTEERDISKIINAIQTRPTLEA